jgi:RND family efflux transporter MFP subunit
MTRKRRHDNLTASPHAWQSLHARQRSIAALLVLGGLLLVAGCTQEAPGHQPQAEGPPPMPPPEVLVDFPVTGDVVDYEDFTGRTVGTRIIDIRARVTGYVQKINFRELEGRDVERGFVLYEIDPRPYQAEVARAKANLLQASAKAKRLDLDFRRAQQLVESKAMTYEGYDLIAGDRAQAQAAVAIEQANLDLAQLNLSFCKVVAPISGRIGRTMVDAGNVVKADETSLTSIVQIDPLHVYFEVDERSLLRIRRYLEEGRLKTPDGTGVTVMMGLADDDGHPYTGHVNFLDNQLDPSTGTLQVRGIFQNTDRMLRPGLFVRVRLPIGEPYRALMVAEEALGTDQGQKYVYVIDDANKAQYRRIEIGKMQDGRRVVLKGLEAGERVVVSGLQRVRPGASVQPKMVATARREDGEQSQAASVEEPAAETSLLPAKTPAPAHGAGSAPWEPPARKTTAGGPPLAR